MHNNVLTLGDVTVVFNSKAVIDSKKILLFELIALLSNVTDEKFGQQKEFAIDVCKQKISLIRIVLIQVVGRNDPRSMRY